MGAALHVHELICMEALIGAWREKERKQEGEPEKEKEKGEGKAEGHIHTTARVTTPSAFSSSILSVNLSIHPGSNAPSVMPTSTGTSRTRARGTRSLSKPV